MTRAGIRPRGGFTLIELMVVLALIAMLVTIALPRYLASVERSKEAVLKSSLRTMRDAIDRYYADNERYPDTLEALASHRYLRDVPVDPETGSARTWVLVTPPPDAKAREGVYDVRSGALGSCRDGTPYAQL